MFYFSSLRFGREENLCFVFGHSILYESTYTLACVNEPDLEWYAHDEGDVSKQ